MKEHQETRIRKILTSYGNFNEKGNLEISNVNKDVAGDMYLISKWRSDLDLLVEAISKLK